MPTKLLPERHNLYGDSLDFKLNIWKEKNDYRDSDLDLDLDWERISDLVT